MNGGICNKNSFSLYTVRAPDLIQSQGFVFLLALQHISMQGRNSLNLFVCQFLEHVSDLHAVLADNIEIVPSCFARPIVLVGMIDAELAERVGGEKDLLFGTIGHHNFRPVNHRRRDELQCQSAEVYTLPFRHDLYVFGIDAELLHHYHRLLRTKHLRLRVLRQEQSHRATMIRFHVVAHQIVGRAAV